MDTRNHSFGSAQPISPARQNGDRRGLRLVTQWTTFNDMFRIACDQLVSIRESNRRAPEDLSNIFLDPRSSEATIERLISLFERFYEQGCICERSADLPYSFPEGSSSKQLGVRLFREALEAFGMALETLALIPPAALSCYLESKIAQFSQCAEELQQELTLRNWDPKVKLRLDEARNQLEFCQTLNDACVTLRVRSVTILLKLVQATDSIQGSELIERACALLDQAELVAPAVAGHQSISALRANIPVLRHLLAID